ITWACNPSGGNRYWNIGSVPLGRAWGTECQPARSKQGVGPCQLGESLNDLVLRVEGTASGWFHRAAKTSHSCSGRITGWCFSGPLNAQWVGSNWTNIFVGHVF
ncbi:hypothetical protein Pfo_017842, partial [Paulownia fortunei]